MNESVNRPAFLKAYESILTVLTVGLALFHLLAAAFQYVFNMKTVNRGEPIAALIIAGLVLFDGILSALFCRENLKRIRAMAARTVCYEQIFLLLLGGWFIVSCSVNSRITGMNLFKRNSRDIFDVLLSALLIFPLGAVMPKKKAEKIMDLLFAPVLLGYSAFTAYALWQVFRLHPVKMPSGNTIAIRDGVLAIQFGCHYNMTASISFLMLVLCLYFMTHKHPAVKISAVLLFPLHLLACYLTNSRTIYLTGLIVVPLFAFCCVRNRLRHRPVRIRVPAALLTAAAVFLLFRAGRPAAFDLFERHTHYSDPTYRTAAAESSISTSAADTETVPAASAVQPVVYDNVRKLTDLNGREAIWRSAVKTILYDRRTFFFGVTPYSVRSALTNIGENPKQPPHAHNGPLQVGVSFGAPLMILYCIYLLRTGMRCLRMLTASFRTPERELYMVPIIMLSLVIPCAVEIQSVRYASTALVFTLLSGRAAARARSKPSPEPAPE